jgi:hydrogenase maturation protease
MRSSEFGVKKKGKTIKTLILGMGNSILSDDAIGLIAAKRVFEALNSAIRNPQSAIELHLSETGGLNLLDIITGYDTLIVIDSIKTGKFKPGEVVEIDAKSRLGSHRLLSSHDVSLFEAMDMGRKLGSKIPDDVRIFGIEILNNTDFSEKLTPEIEKKLDSIVDQIIEQISGKSY